MNLKLLAGDKTRNYIFVIAAVLTLISIVITFALGAVQDKSFLNNYRQYQQAVKMMGDQKYTQALQVFQGLDTDSQASYQVLYMEGFCASQTGDYEEAAIYMERAQTIRPALLQDQKFLQRYGAILYQLGEYERAAIYLQESLRYPYDAQVTPQASSCLAEIEKKLGGEKHE